ncbi:MAG: hypothetical protein ACR2OC_10620 [Solirubrobacterales bacterium]
MIAALALASPAAAEAYDPADQPPFGGEPVPEAIAPARDDVPPPGFELSADEVVTIADHTEIVRTERAESPGIEPRALTRGPGRWEVKYFLAEDGGLTEVAQVHVSDPDGEVLEAWRDHQVETKLARGYDGAVGRAINSPWIWIALCLLFVAPFFDPRRLLRLVHLDLFVIVGLSLSLLFFNRGEITTSVPLVYPVLGYFFARLLIAGLRPRERAGPLVQDIPIAVVAGLAVALAAGRIALNIADSSVIDIGVAGVVGADRIGDGASLYEGVFAPGIDLRGDVYGPLNYLLYMPFELAFPWQGVWDDVPAAHAAAIAFDLLTALGLLALGGRLREGAEGRALGVVLAFAWLACPWTTYALNANSNDSLVALAIVGAMLALTSAPLRGAAVALGTAAKFGPLALAPLFAAGTGERRLRSIVLFSIAFVLVTVLVFLPFLPDGGPREVYDRTFGYQASRGSPFSIWGLAPSLEPLQVAARVLAVALGIAVAFIPRRRSALQIAALGAAVVIATQVAGGHWFYFYVLWFLPLALVAIFGESRMISPRSERSPSPAGPASAS